MWLVPSDVHGPLWVVTKIQRISRTVADWLSRYLDFTTGQRTGAVRWDGMGRNRLQGHDVHNTTGVAGPPGQTNWISQDLDSFSHNQVNQQDQINPKKLENRYQIPILQKNPARLNIHQSFLSVSHVNPGAVGRLKVGTPADVGLCRK